MRTSILLTRPDHEVVGVSFDWDILAARQRPQADVATSGLQTAPTWATDVRTHAAWIQQAMLTHCQVARQGKPRKFHMSADTWALIRAKTATRKMIRRIPFSLRLRNLRAIFQAWSVLRFVDECEFRHLSRFRRWTRLQQMALAHAESAFRILSRQVTKSMRQDDHNYYEMLAREAGDAGDEGMRAIWPKIRALLPQAVKRRKHNTRCRGPDVAS